jgi:hypothetical protein
MNVLRWSIGTTLCVALLAASSGPGEACHRPGTACDPIQYCPPPAWPHPCGHCWAYRMSEPVVAPLVHDRKSGLGTASCSLPIPSATPGARLTARERHGPRPTPRDRCARR